MNNLTEQGELVGMLSQAKDRLAQRVDGLLRSKYGEGVIGNITIMVYPQADRKNVKIRKKYDKWKKFGGIEFFKAAGSDKDITQDIIKDIKLSIQALFAPWIRAPLTIKISRLICCDRGVGVSIDRSGIGFEEESCDCRPYQ